VLAAVDEGHGDPDEWAFSGQQKARTAVAVWGHCVGRDLKLMNVLAISLRESAGACTYDNFNENDLQYQNIIKAGWQRKAFGRPWHGPRKRPRIHMRGLGFVPRCSAALRGDGLPYLHLCVGRTHHRITGLALERGGERLHVCRCGHGADRYRCMRVGVEPQLHLLLAGAAAPDACPVEEEALVFGVAVDLLAGSGRILL
jgi:hypothetical protein